MEKYLIVGLGNKGFSYQHTRHNIGFMVLDILAKNYSINFSPCRFGNILYFSLIGKLFILLKPNTFMNLSGISVKYCMEKEQIIIEKLLIITDDLHLKLGTFRIRDKGGYGGHKGLKNIQEILTTSHYPRFRIGIGGKFSRGKQKDYVLSEWTNEEFLVLSKSIDEAGKAIISFVMSGLQKTMNIFNKK
ncbi:aminoacyl-tRNA hydrolase [Candidatus Walczuchella endosymbiont of Icerya purchasi]|uniref:aminoacyl-tRNA hydrolase n=1 Tax=Candidatus Walczuchella endosymbiont of Icerya purchasi TaxID=3066219 RepID=UPI00313ED847